MCPCSLAQKHGHTMSIGGALTGRSPRLPRLQRVGAPAGPRHRTRAGRTWQAPVRHAFSGPTCIAGSNSALKPFADSLLIIKPHVALSNMF